MVRTSSLPIAALALALSAAGCTCAHPPTPARQPTDDGAGASTPPGPTQVTNGFAVAASFPNDDATRFAYSLAVAVDDQGDPLLAYASYDENGDHDFSDSHVWFVGYDHAGKRFRPPVQVAALGGDTRMNRDRVLSFAHDRDTGAVGIAYVPKSTGPIHVHLALSTDGGATWKNAQLTEEATRPGERETHPDLAMAKGEVHVAYTSGHATHYRHGPERAEPSTWAPGVAVPAPPNGGATDACEPAVAVDANGAAAVAYWVAQRGPDGWALAFFRPDRGAPVVAATSKRPMGERLRLAFEGTSPKIAALANFGTRAEDTGVWAVGASDDGTSWTPPVRVPNDGSTLPGFQMGFAATSGRGAIATDIGGGGSTAVECGAPKLARTTDFAAWKTCSATMQPTPRFDYAFPAVAYTPSGKLVLAFHHLNDREGLPAGVVVYREEG